MSSAPTGQVAWVRFDVESLRLSQQISLLILQSMPLLKLFEDCTFEGADAGGTFVFLRGDLTPLHKPPLHLQHIVLAQINSISQGMTPQEVLSALLADVL